MHAQWYIVGIAPNYKLVLLQFRPLFIFISMRTTVRQGSLHIDMQPWLALHYEPCGLPRASSLCCYYYYYVWEHTN